MPAQTHDTLSDLPVEWFNATPHKLQIENYYYYIRLTAFFPNNLGKPAPER